MLSARKNSAERFLDRTAFLAGLLGCLISAPLIVAALFYRLSLAIVMIAAVIALTVFFYARGRSTGNISVESIGVGSAIGLLFVGTVGIAALIFSYW